MVFAFIFAVNGVYTLKESVYVIDYIKKQYILCLMLYIICKISKMDYLLY